MQAMADPRDRAYAELIVGDCLKVEHGWQVLVGGNPQARPLLEELCGAIGRRDGPDAAAARHGPRHRTPNGR